LNGLVGFAHRLSAKHKTGWWLPHGVPGKFDTTPSIRFSMPKLISDQAKTLNALVTYRMKNLVKRLSDGWSITVTERNTGELLSISLLTESGTFHSTLHPEELDTLVEQGLLDSREKPGKYLNVTSYALK
jgi:hypothetical protein